MTSKPATLVSSEMARPAAGASAFQIPSSRMPTAASGMTSSPVLKMPSSLALLLSVSAADGRWSAFRLHDEGQAEISADDDQRQNDADEIRRAACYGRAFWLGHRLALVVWSIGGRLTESPLQPTPLRRTIHRIAPTADAPAAGDSPSRPYSRRPCGGRFTESPLQPTSLQPASLQPSSHWPRRPSSRAQSTLASLRHARIRQPAAPRA